MYGCEYGNTCNLCSHENTVEPYWCEYFFRNDLEEYCDHQVMNNEVGFPTEEQRSEGDVEQ